MHALAMLRYHNTGCSDARCFAACPYAFAGVSSEWLRQVCATSAAVVGGAPGPVPQERGTGRGCLPPGTAGLEVTRPWALERQKRHQQRHFHFTIRASYLVTSVDKHQLSIFEETPTTSPAKKTEKILLVRLVNICSKSSHGVGSDEKYLAANKARSELLSGNSQSLLSWVAKELGRWKPSEKNCF